jgi:hypothetical protein
MATFELGVSSADAIQFYPEFDYSADQPKIEDEIRSASGRLYAYKWGSYKKFRFSAEFVPASDAAVVNSWWQSNAQLLFFITSDSTTEVSSVMVRGKSRPFQSYNQPYDNLMKGTILLEGY